MTVHGRHSVAAPPSCNNPTPPPLPGPSEAQLRDAVLLVPGQRPDGVLRAPAPDHRSRLLLRGEAEAQLSGAAGHLQDQLHLQVAQLPACPQFFLGLSICRPLSCGAKLC